DMGLGFYIVPENGTRKIYHEGAQEKARCRMVIYPDSQSAVVVMTNSEHVNPGQISTAVFSGLAKK
ncbi:hypothetical protein EON80_07265, partial [bacterium]